MTLALTGLPSANMDTIRALSDRIDACKPEVGRLDTYYDGLNRLLAMGLALPPEMRVLETVVNWPRLVVDSIAERMTVTGFRLADQSGSDDRLWSWWQANNLDEESRLQHVEALVQKRAFIVVGSGDDSTVPLITVESPRSMAVEIDPRTRRATAALRLYGEKDGQDTLATLYLPDETLFFSLLNGQWRQYDRIVHNLGRVPVVPMVNRARLHDRHGRSEMADVISLTDAACRSLTNLQGAQELLAVPQRYLLGVTKDDFRDANGQVIAAWEAYIGRYAMLANENAKAGQFPAADLRNFTEVINLYARMVAGIAGLPPHFLGLSTDNPASADAIRSAEARLIMRTRDRMTTFSGAWEEAMRIAIGWVDGDIPAATARLETVWASPETPTFAAKADAVTKLVQANILPPDAALEELGYSSEQRARWAGMRQRDPVAALTDAVVNG